MGTAQPSDAELLARLRNGDSAAFATLRARELPADADLDRERDLVLDAYATLPARTRAVLWLTEVEGHAAGVLATLLGMTPSAVAALAARARDQLRDAYLGAHLRAEPRADCGRPHRSRLVGYVRHGRTGRVRTATTVHIEGCSGCRALAAAVGDAPRRFARALAPWCAVTIATDGDADPDRPTCAAPTATTAAATMAGPAVARPRSRRRSAPALVGAGRYARHIAATARRDPALAGTVAVAAALVVAVLATALLPGDAPADPAAPHSPAVDGMAADQDVPGVPAVDHAPSTSTSVPGPVALRPSDPAAAAPPPTDRPGPDPSAVDRVVVPAAPAPPAAAPPGTTTAPATLPDGPDLDAPAVPAGDGPVVGVAASPAVPSVISAVWRQTASRVEVTLLNSGASSTGFLVMTLEAAGGALVDAQPSGCALAVGMFTTAMCTLRPLGPGASAVVEVPMRVTHPGQSAEVQVCTVALLRLDCATPLLAPTVVDLA